MVTVVGEGARSVVLVGDSHLAEHSTRDVNKLGRRLTGQGWVVHYRAVGGFDTRAALALQAPVPDAAWTIVSLGANDAAPWKQVPVPEFRSNLHRLLQRYGHSELLVLGPPPVREPASDPLGRTNAVLLAYGQAASEVAETVGAAFLDLFDLVATDGSHHVEDGLHLNDDAYEALLAAVLQRLSSVG
jgi:lysophospholipase L1-like esterase